MAGKAKAPRVFWDENTQRWRCRFTHEKRRYEFSNSALKQQQQAEAARWSATMVADVLAGRWGKPIQGSDPHAKLSQVGAAYLLEKSGGEISAETAELRKMHLATHLVPSFPRLSDVTRSSLASYQARRLKEVTYETVKKELSTLRQVLLFAQTHGWISEIPKFPDRPGKSKGTRHKHGSTGHTSGVTVAMVQAMLPYLPEFSRRSRLDGRRWPIRGLVEILYESGLRPGFWFRFRVGTHWKRGWSTLKITADVDKNRWGREVPLTPRAIEILESLPYDESGRMFDDRDFRSTIRKAAAKVMPPELARRFHLNDLRHIRTTEMTSTGNLLGTQFLVGHLRVTTTNRYVHASMADAEKVVAQLSVDCGAVTGAEPPPEHARWCDAPPDAALFGCAKERTRTSTGVTPPAPQGAVSIEFGVISHDLQNAEARLETPETAHSGAVPQNGVAAWALAYAADRFDLLPLAPLLGDHLRAVPELFAGGVR